MNKGHSNIIPASERTPEERRENGRKGAKVANEKKRRKRTMREALELIANEPVTNKKLISGFKNLADGIDAEDIDMIMAATMGVFQAAIKGNVSAYALIGQVLDEVMIENDAAEDELSKSLRELGESL